MIPKKGRKIKVLINTRGIEKAVQKAVFTPNIKKRIIETSIIPINALLESNFRRSLVKTDLSFNNFTLTLPGLFILLVNLFLKHFKTSSWRPKKNH